MKKVIFVLAVMFICMAVASFAEESIEAKDAGQDKTMKMDMEKSTGMGGMHPMQRGMMMQMMTAKSMVATLDGGVIVLVGNKLLKYDKNLNLKKEVEINVGPQVGGGMMKSMKEKFPRGRMSMQDCQMMQEGSSQEPAEEEAR